MNLEEKNLELRKFEKLFQYVVRETNNKTHVKFWFDRLNNHCSIHASKFLLVYKEQLLEPLLLYE